MIDPASISGFLNWSFFTAVKYWLLAVLVFSFASGVFVAMTYRVKKNSYIWRHKHGIFVWIIGYGILFPLTSMITVFLVAIAVLTAMPLSIGYWIANKIWK